MNYTITQQQIQKPISDIISKLEMETKLRTEAKILKGHCAAEVSENGIYVHCDKGTYLIEGSSEESFWSWLQKVRQPMKAGCNLLSNREDNYIDDIDITAYAEAHRDNWKRVYDEEGACL